MRGTADIRGDGGGEGTGDDNATPSDKNVVVFACVDITFCERKFDVSVEDAGDESSIRRLFLGEFEARFCARVESAEGSEPIPPEVEWIIPAESKGDWVQCSMFKRCISL